jgi:hypothetical protein
MRDAYIIVYGISVRKPEGKKPLGRHRHRWGMILVWVLNKGGLRLWTDFIWIKTKFSGSLLRTKEEPMCSLREGVRIS